MESFFGRLKDHIRNDIAGCRSVSEIRERIHDFIDYYNNDRYQWDLAKLSPCEFYSFCVTGEYPLQTTDAPAVPVAEQNPKELKRRAETAQAKSNSAKGGSAGQSLSHGMQYV